MDIVKLVDKYGEIYGPYKGKLINNLPIGQLALYKINNDIREVENLTRCILNRRKIDKVKKAYPKVRSIDECLGKRKLYEPCLDLLKEDLENNAKKEYISYILNKYEFGMSSGLFHTLTRVYYAVDAFENDQRFINEIARSLAYYITAYSQGDLFTRSVDSKDVFKELEKLRNNIKIETILEDNDTTGKKMRELYANKRYTDLGFIIKGTEEEKIKVLLDILLPAFINGENIIVFHCITGLQALVGLKEYYEDFNRALDILTTTIITHLITVENLNFALKEEETLEYSWDYILSMASQSTYPHNIEIANSCNELYKIYPTELLKTTVLKKVDNI